MFNYTCEECGKGSVIETEVNNYEIKIFDKPFVVPSAKIGLCDSCGTRNYDGKEMHRWKELYNAWNTKSEEYLSPRFIRRVRKSFGLNQKTFAAFIGVTRQSLSAWENDKRPSVQPQIVDIVLKMLFAELERDEKPVTIKMIEEYNKRAGNLDQTEIKTSVRSFNKNEALKNILPQTTWGVLIIRANKNKTDPFTENVLCIEIKTDMEGEKPIEKIIKDDKVEWKDKPPMFNEYYPDVLGVSKKIVWSFNTLDRKPKYES